MGWQVMLNYEPLPDEWRIARDSADYNAQQPGNEYHTDTILAYRALGLVTDVTITAPSAAAPSGAVVYPAIAPWKDCEVHVAGGGIHCPAFRRALHCALRALVDRLGVTQFNVAIFGIPPRGRKAPGGGAMSAAPAGAVAAGAEAGSGGGGAGGALGGGVLARIVSRGSPASKARFAQEMPLPFCGPPLLLRVAPALLSSGAGGLAAFQMQVESRVSFAHGYRTIAQPAAAKQLRRSPIQMSANCGSGRHESQAIKETGPCHMQASDFGALEVHFGASIGHTCPWRVHEAIQMQLAAAMAA